MKRFFKFLFALLTGFILALVVVAVWRSDDGLPVGERIGVVEVKGFIADPRHAVEALRDLRRDEKVKSVIVRVDSPGGVIAPSQEIHAEVKRTAEAKPVVISMGALGASGAYYLSAPATRIVANPGTATGSIGVILQFTEVHMLFNKLGLQTRVVKSGKLKDAGSPFREMSETDRAVFQALIDDMFDQFVEAIAEGRGMAQEDVLGLADGRIFSGRQALESGLVDQLGGFWDAVTVAQKLGGLTGEPNLDYRKRRRGGVLRWFLGEEAEALAPLGPLSSPAFRYALPSW